MTAITLFRASVINANADPGSRSAPLTANPSWRLLNALFCMLAGTVALFVFLGSYTAKDPATGVITTTSGNIPVFAQTEGVVEELFVSEGDEVASGQPLLRLGTSRALQRNGMISDLLLQTLSDEESSLLGRLSQERLLLDARERQVDDELRQLSGMLQLAASMQDIARQSLDVATAQLARVSDSTLKSFSPAVVIDEWRGAELLRRADWTESKLELQQLRLRHSQLLQEKQAVPVLRAMKEEEIRAQLARTRQEKISTEASREQLLLAPYGGVVTALDTREGQTVSRLRALLSLVPKDREFYLELDIPVRSMGFVRPGTTIHIRYDAYPHQSFGIHRGRITSIAGTASIAAAAGRDTPAVTAYYRAIATLEQQGVRGYGRQFELQAGMTASVDLRRDKRRIIDWIFDPLLGAVGRL